MYIYYAFTMQKFGVCKVLFIYLYLNKVSYY